MFTATRWQVATYLLAVCPFSIAFLVFLNSSVSFVVTDLIGKIDGVGDAVGTLGFADELVALVACPLWGLLSDRLGVRIVCCIGYLVIGLALFVFVQSRNVYPQLLLARLLFSIGGSAASTMVTAVLPIMSVPENAKSDQGPNSRESRPAGHTHAVSFASDLTITPANYHAERTSHLIGPVSPVHADPISKIAGFVGMATGCGALVALGLFLPLPARFQHAGIDPRAALQYSYYIVGSISFVLAVVCFFGFRGLHDQSIQTRHSLTASTVRNRNRNTISGVFVSTTAPLYQALRVGFLHKKIFIGYVGGFVARASSVAISLFIPLLVNAAFQSTGLCNPDHSLENPAGLPEIKRRCPRAYIVAAELTGASQFVALLCAPLFGYMTSRLSNKVLPLGITAVAGIIGYPLFTSQFDPHDENKGARAAAFLAACLIGISQIGAIVCSLSVLATGILEKPVDGLETQPSVAGAALADQDNNMEAAPLLGVHVEGGQPKSKLSNLKGSVAGVYSFYGGAGILILTKVGGTLFDTTSTAAPFHMMAVFNGLLLLATIFVSVR